MSAVPLGTMHVSFNAAEARLGERRPPRLSIFEVAIVVVGGVLLIFASIGFATDGRSETIAVLAVFWVLTAGFGSMFYALGRRTSYHLKDQAVTNEPAGPQSEAERTRRDSDMRSVSPREKGRQLATRIALASGAFTWTFTGILQATRGHVWHLDLFDFLLGGINGVCWAVLLGLIALAASLLRPAYGATSPYSPQLTWRWTAALALAGTALAYAGSLFDL
jgi:hypothetical protein